MGWRKLASFGVMAAFMAMLAGTSKPKSDEIDAGKTTATPTTTAPPVAPTISAAPTVAPSAQASAAPEADAPKPPNPDKSCDPKNDTTCEFRERCVPDGKKRTNGTGTCVVGCPAGLAPGPGGCGRKCATDADCTKPTESCPSCKKCKLVTDPPRGKICQS